MKKISFILSLLLFFQISASAQYSVQVGTDSYYDYCYQPSNNQFDYGWSATVYKQSDINSHGSITDIFYKSRLGGSFGPGSGIFMIKQRIFMKLVTDEAMTSNAFPDTTQMTRVYAGMVEFLNYQLATFHLDVPFNLDINHNLMILYINNHGLAQTNSDYFLRYPAQHNNQTINSSVYNTSNSVFPSGAGSYSDDMPVVYLKYASGLDAGISAINQNETFMLPQQADLTCNFRNFMADTISSTDIEWALNGTPQTTYNWTGNNYCGQESPPIILKNNFDFAPGQYLVKANTANTNGSIDELNTNDTLNFNINVSDHKTQAAWSYADNKILFLSNKPYGWSVSIYNKDSINFSGQINATAYYVLDNNGMVEPHQKIFMRTTSDMTNSSTDYPDTNLFTKVFDGDIDYSSIGWHIIELDTVFNYNSSENLIVLYENHAGISTSIATGFKVGWVQTNAIYNYDLHTFPTGAGSIASNSRVPAIQLYFSIPKDAGVTHLANSEVPVFTENNDFIIDFKNFGLDTLQDVDIKYQVDQNTPSSYHWNGTAIPQNEIINLNVGTSNLAYGDHLVNIWTENPNFLPDYVNRNDTFKISLRACHPLSGTYTVGAAPSDFLTVKAAVDSLNNCGINGAVTFNIKSGTYNSQYVLDEVLGSSATNTITFQSETGDSTDVVLTTDSTDYLFNLYGADYITFKHLSLKSDSATNLIVLDSTTTHNQFIGNVFTSDTSTCTFITSVAGFNQDNIFISNNLFEKGKIGININQNDILLNANLLIQNNTFNNQSNQSIGIYNLKQVCISNNNFNIKYKGIYFKNCDNININDNNLKLNSANEGINIEYSFTAIISNNFISGKTSGYENTGIYILVTKMAKLFYNSINMIDAESAINCNNSDSLFAYNNIFICRSSQTIKKYSTVYTGDYNCFFTDNTIFGSNDSSIPDLTSWQTSTSQDANSIFARPYYESDSNLHTNSPLVDNQGTPIAGITTDIDGNLRDATNPDIGADEFTSTCTGSLAGAYTIGTTGDYQTFNDAVLALYNCGLAGSVIFEIQSGTYTEQVTIDGNIIYYTNGIKPVTFTSQSQNPDDVILKYNADTLNNFTLKVKDITGLTIDKITIEAADTSFGRVVNMLGIVDSCMFSNNKIIGVNTAKQTTCVAYNELNKDSLMTITFNGNTINNGKDGISQIDGSIRKEGLTLNIINNTFNNQKRAAIYSEYNKIFIITGNNITSDSANYGIYTFYTSDSLNISQNKIILTKNHNTGISIANSSPSFISNNFIATKNGYYGIWLYGSGKILNNTIITTNKCIEISNSASLVEILNNCLISFSTIIDNTSNYIIDYNNLFSYSTYFNYNSFINTIGGNAHSVSFMPDFVSETDLHTNSALLNGKGIPVAGVTVDIDGEPRDVANPDIGADEFNSPVFVAGNDTVFCYNTNSNYPVYAGSHIYDIGYGYDSYSWSNGSDSSSILIDSIYTQLGNTQYTVTVTTGSDTYSDTVNILYDLPDAILQNEYCYWNSPFVITANSGYLYKWSTGDTTQSITINSGGGYPELTLTDEHGCKSRETIHIHTTFEEPANINPTDTSICRNQPITLHANTYANDDLYDTYSFEWNVGDTTQNINIDPSILSLGEHPFIVTVYLISDMLCSSTDTIMINIQDCLGVEENDAEVLHIYPNPTNESLIIQSEQEIQNYEVYTLAGELVSQVEIESKRYAYDVSALSAGIYLLKLNYGNFSKSVKFTVKP